MTPSQKKSHLKNADVEYTQSQLNAPLTLENYLKLATEDRFRLSMTIEQLLRAIEDIKRDNRRDRIERNRALRELSDFKRENTFSSPEQERMARTVAEAIEEVRKTGRKVSENALCERAGIAKPTHYRWKREHDRYARLIYAYVTECNAVVGESQNLERRKETQFTDFEAIDEILDSGEKTV